LLFSNIQSQILISRKLVASLRSKQAMVTDEDGVKRVKVCR
jgi:hypothetical protein